MLGGLKTRLVRRLQNALSLPQAEAGLIQLRRDQAAATAEAAQFRADLTEAMAGLAHLAAPRLAARDFIRPPGRTIHVLTALDHNHRQRPMPLDARFLAPAAPHAFYFFDPDLDLAGFPGLALRESDVAPNMAEAGRRHLAEWTFLLAEYERPFLGYPFFATSSRFYEKNTRLARPLPHYAEDLFALLERYGWGYLPSYDRDFGFCDMEEYIEKGYLGTTGAGQDFIAELYGVRMPEQYRYVSDFWCNYIGFHSRIHLERYVEFYLPMLRRFFTPDWQQAEDYLAMGLVRSDVAFRALKPLTLLLEQVSHMFFLKNRIPFFGLHYDGFHEVREWEASSTLIQPHCGVSSA